MLESIRGSLYQRHCSLGSNSNSSTATIQGIYKLYMKEIKKLNTQKYDQNDLNDEHKELFNPEDTIENQVELVENLSERTFIILILFND